MPNIEELAAIRDRAKAKLDRELAILNALIALQVELSGAMSDAWMAQKAVVFQAKADWDKANDDYLFAFARTRDMHQ
jgi:hypothetical protein